MTILWTGLSALSSSITRHAAVWTITDWRQTTTKCGPHWPTGRSGSLPVPSTEPYKKTKARDCVPGWPRSRSTMALFPGTRFMGKPFVLRMQYYRYVPLSLASGNIAGTAEVVTPSFQYVTEDSLEREYHRGQAAMVDRFRAEYRRLTHEDLQWLRAGSEEPLREAMKSAWYKLYLNGLGSGTGIPLTLCLAIKMAARNDKPFWYRFRRAQTDNSALFA
jgi:hypothetical protein